MKKLLLAPVVLMTAFLAFAFLMPATAAGVVRSVAPIAHVALPAVLTLGSQNQTAAKPAGSQDVNSPASSGGTSASRASSNTTLQDSASQPLISVNDRGHAVATSGHPNCGRFGDGMHGGKHDFTCPNRPFPDPVTN
jgi:hypothetical protein